MKIHAHGFAAQNLNGIELEIYRYGGLRRNNGLPIFDAEVLQAPVICCLTESYKRLARARQLGISRAIGRRHLWAQALGPDKYQ